MDTESFILYSSIIANIYQLFVGIHKTKSETNKNQSEADNNDSKTRLNKTEELDKFIATMHHALGEQTDMYKKLNREFNDYKDSTEKKIAYLTKAVDIERNRRLVLSKALTDLTLMACKKKKCKDKQYLGKKDIDNLTLNEEIIGDGKK